MQGSGDREEGPGHTCSWDPATLMPCFLFVSQMKEKPWFDVRDVAKNKNTPSPPPSESGVCLNTCQKSESATSKASFLYGDHGIRPLHPSKGTPDVSCWAWGHLGNGRTGLPPLAPHNTLSEDESSNHREQIFSGSQKSDAWKTKEGWQTHLGTELAQERMGQE